MPDFTDDPIHCNADTVGPDAVILAENQNRTPTAGFGLFAKSYATAVRGDGEQWCGVVGYSSSTIGGVGVWGEHQAGGTGVYGRSLTEPSGRGVWGHSATDTGVYGQSDKGSGMFGESKGWMGVYGLTASVTGGAGVMGEHKGGGTGVRAVSKSGIALEAASESNEAVHASTKSPDRAAIAAYNDNPAATGAAIYAKKSGDSGWAGFFDGNVHVTRDITLANGDCAEDFDVADADSAAPGTVMVLGDNGALHQCEIAYDKRVAGILAGAGGYRPGIVLDRQPAAGDKRRPIALVGKVCCKVDSSYGPIAVGDLLTTSPTAGHAMKAMDRDLAFGAVIGKALGSVSAGCSVIPVLVALQ